MPTDIHDYVGARKFSETVTMASEVVRTGGKVTALEVDARVPDGTSVDAVIEQQFPDGAEDDGNRQTIAVEDGETTYEVTELEYGGERVWIEFNLRSVEGDRFPGVSSYRLLE